MHTHLTHCKGCMVVEKKESAPSLLSPEVLDASRKALISPCSIAKAQLLILMCFLYLSYRL